MKDKPTIAVVPRERTGSRYSERLRNQGRLPAIIYGHKIDPLAVSVDEKEMLTHLHHGAHVVTLEVEGGKAETCLVKDLQFGFLGDNVIHIDFARVDLNEEVNVHVRLNFTGEPKSAQKTDAILTHDLNELVITCRVSDIPEEIRVDLTTMGEETLMTTGQIDLPEGVALAQDPSTPVAHVGFVHAEEAEGEEVEVETDVAEPEVITEGKTEDDSKKPGADS